MSSSSDIEVLRIGKQLEKIANSDTPVGTLSQTCTTHCVVLRAGIKRNNAPVCPPQNDEIALDLMRSLQGLPMSLDILQVI